MSESTRSRAAAHRRGAVALGLVAVAVAVLRSGGDPAAGRRLEPAAPLRQSGVDAFTAWPTTWTSIATDGDEGGCDAHRNVLESFYAADTEFIYLRLTNEDPAGWPGTGPAGDARYKWFLDTVNMDAVLSGGSVVGAEWQLMVEDLCVAPDCTVARNQLGEQTLMDDFVNGGFTARWGANSPPDYTNNAIGSADWVRVLGTGTAGAGGPQGTTSDPDIGFRVDGNNLDMYVSKAAIGNPPTLRVLWATDNQDPNLDSAPNCDKPDSDTFQTIVASTPTPTNTASNTPTTTNTPTSTSTSTPTSTPTNTPTSTPTDTPTNTPTSTSTNTPTNTPTNTATATPNPNADLSIVKSASSPTVLAGNNVVYTLNVANGGPQSAVNVVVVDDLPAGTSYVSVTSSTGSCGQVPTNRIQCDLNTIASGGSATITVTVKVDAGVPAGTVLTNTAQVSSDTPDNNNANDIDQADVLVAALSNIVVAKTDSPDPVLAGNLVEYRVTVRNLGPSVARNYRLIDSHGPSLAYLTFDSATVSPAGSCVFSLVDSGVRCALGDLPVGTLYVATIRWRVNANTPHLTVLNDAVSQFADSPITLDAASDTTESTTVQAAADLAIDKTVQPSTAVAGENVKWTITVRNLGPSDAPGVQVVDTLPPGFLFLSDSDACVEGPIGTLTCSLGTLPAGAVTSFDVFTQIDPLTTPGPAVNTAVVFGLVSDPAIANNSDTAEMTVGTRADLRMMKMAVPNGPVPAGSPIVYTLMVDNLGPSFAYNVTLSDVLTSSGTFTVQSITSDRPATCTPPTPAAGSNVTVNCALTNPLEPPTVGSGRWTVTVVVTASGGQTINNVATVASPTPDPNLANNKDALTRGVNDVADLAIDKVAAPGPYTAGRQTSYLLTVTNAGPSTAHNVVVTDSLDPRLSFVSAVASQGACGFAAGVVTCNLGNIPALGSATVTLTVAIDPDVPQGTDIPNTAVVRSDDPDPDASDNVDTEIIPIRARADLSVLKADAPDPVVAGNLLVYTLAVANDGPSTAANAVVSDPLPAAVKFVSAVVAGNLGACVYNAGTHTVACSLGDLPPDAARTITVTVQVKPGTPPGGLSNTATVASDTIDPDATNDSDTEPTTVTAAADLRLDKTAASATAVAGDLVRWTLTVTNLGPSNAAAVQVVDTLPAGFVYVSDTDACVQGPPGTLTCSLGTVPAGGVVAFDVFTTVGAGVAAGTYINSATASSATADPTPANNTDTASVAVVARADLKITKFAAPAGPVPAGTPIVYTFYVDNLGPSAASGVELTDAITSSGNFVVNSIASDRPATCTPATPTAPAGSRTVNCALTGALEPQSVGTGRWTVTVSVTAASGQTINNLATVEATTPDPNLANNMDMASRTVNDLADLAVVKSSPAASAAAGTNATFTIAVTNNGPSTATNVVVGDDLPAGLGLVSAVADGGGACALVPTNRVECAWGSIPSGGVRTVTLVVAVDPTTPGGTVLHNTAVVNADTPDPNIANNADPQDLLVVASADLSLVKSDSPDPVVAGNLLTYLLIVTNLGPSAVPNPTVFDTLPPQSTFVSAHTAMGVCSYDAGLHRVQCTLPDQPPVSVRLVTVTVRVNPGTPPGVVNNTANVVSEVADANPANNSDAEPTTVIAAADLRVVKTAEPVVAVAGEGVRWTVAVHNDGPSDAAGVQVVDTLPAGFIYVANTDACVQGPPGTLTCSLGTVPAGGVVAFDIVTTVGAGVPAGTHVNSATASAATADPTPANNTDTASVAVVARADLKITKFAAPAGPVPAGTPIVYTFYVDNLGPSAASGVELTDAITSSGNFVVNSIASDRPATCTPATPTAPAGSRTVNCALTGALEPQSVGTGRWTVTVSVTAASGQTINNLATVKATTPDPNPANNMDMASRTVNDLADLAVVKDGPAGPVVAGGNATYTLTVTNGGPSAATNVVVYDDLPPGLVFLSASATGGGACALVPTNRVECAWGTIPSGGVRTVTLEVTVDPGVADGTVIHNTAVVNADTPDPNIGNNLDAHDITIIARADLSIAKSDAPDPVVAGNGLTYQLTVTNGGPSAAANVVVSDVLPPQTTFVGVVAPGGACAYNAGLHTVTCLYGSLPPGDVRVATIAVQVKPGTPPGIINNAAVVSSTTVDLDPADNGDLEPTTVTAAADLRLDKTVAPLTAAAGDLVQWTITVSNLGPSDAAGVQVVDTLPAGFVYVANTDACVQGPPGTLTCSLGTVPAGGVVAFDIVTTVGAGVPAGTYVNSATASAATADPTPANNTDTASVAVVARADLKVTKFAAPAGPVPAGTPIVYTFYVDNLGPSAASGVELTDAITSSGNFVVNSIASDRPATCTPATPTAPASSRTVNCALTGALEPQSGGTGRWTVTVSLTAASGQTINNLATVKATTPDPNPANNMDMASRTVNDLADLAVVKNGPLLPVAAGTNTTFVIVVTNNGPSTATNVVMADDLPAGLGFVSASATGGGACALVPTDRVTCAWGSIPSGGVRVVTLNVAVDAGVPGGTVIHNTAVVNADTPDANIGNNLDGQDLTVVAVANLALLKSDSPDPVVAGSLLTYQLLVTNLGPSDAPGTTVFDTLPPSTTFVSAHVAGGACSHDAGLNRVQCSLGTLPPLAFRLVTITVRVDPGTPPGVIDNEAAVLSGALDLNPGNNVDDEPTTVVVAADLRVVKSVDPVVAVAGDTVKWTVTVHNDGPSTAQNVTVVDVLPAGFMYLSDSDSCVQGPVGTLTCSLGTVAAGGSAAFDIFTMVGAATPPGGYLNTAAVDSTTPDPNDGNDVDTAVVTVKSRADLRVLKVASPSGPVGAGDEIRYLLVVDNLGPSAATGVTLVDALSSDGLFDVVSVDPDVDGNRPTATCAPAAPLVNVTGATLTCSLNAGVLEPFGPSGSGRWRVEVVVTARGAQTVNNIATTAHAGTDPDLSNNVDELARDITDVADLAIVKTDGPDPATAGGPLVYQLTVTNSGPSAATNVVVADTVPPGLTVQSATVPGGACTIVANQVSCNLGTLPAPAVRVVTIVATVNGNVPAGTTLINSATVRADSYDPTTANNVDSEPTTIVGAADLSITKADAVDPATAGGALSYVLTVANGGPSGAADVEVVDQLPAGTLFVGASAQGGSCVHQAGPNVVDCTLGYMASGEVRTITVNVVVDAGVPHGAVLVNRATVASATFDPDPIDNVAVEPTTVRAVADLRLDKSAAPPTLLAGDTVRYTIQVTNDGPSDAVAVVVGDTLPAGFTFLHDSDACVEAPSGTLTCSLGPLAAGASTSFDVFARVNAATPPGVYTNAAVATSPTTDPNPANNADSVDVSVVTLADLRITKTAVPSGPVEAGDTIDYTIYVDNLGPSSAVGAVMRDAITSDGQFDLISVTSSRPAVCAPTSAPNIASTTVDCALAGALEPVGVGGDGRWRITVRLLVNDAQTVNNVATIDADTPDPDPANNIDELSRDVTAIADLAVDKTSTAIPSPLVAGGQIRYEVVVTNTGPSPADNVVLADRLPPGITVTDYAATDAEDGPVGCSTGTPGSAADPLRCGFGPLGVDDTVTVVFTATVDSDLPDGTVLENDAFAFADNPDPDNGNNHDATLDTVATSADVSILKTDTPDPATAGEALSYVLLVANDGPSTARDVVVSDPLPAGTTFVNASVAGGTCAYAAGPRTVTCALGDLAVGASRVVVVNVEVDADVADGTVLANTATVSSSTDDPDPGNNVDDAATTVDATADLSIDKTAAGSGVPGSEIRYTITVSNHGPSTAQDVTVAEFLPAGVTFVWDDDNCGAGGTPCSLGDIAAGDSVTFHVAVRVNADAIGVLENRATAGSTTPDPDPTNNTDIAAVTAVPTADMQIMKYSVPAILTTGEPMVYTLVIQNLGPGLARNVVIDDTFIADGSYTITAISGAACAPGPGPFSGTTVRTCSLGDMAPFTQRLVSFTVTTTDSTKLVNVAAVRSDAVDPNLTNNKADVSNDIRQSADVSVEKTSQALPGPGVVAGQQIKYTVVVRNGGPSRATGVRLFDRLPAGIVVTGYMALGPDGETPLGCTTGTAGSANDQLACEIGALAAGQSATVMITAAVHPHLPGGSVLENDVLVTADTFDRDPSDNRDTTIDVVGTSADLSVAKFGSPSPVRAGEITTYDIVYQNAGPSAARDVIVTDVLPPYLDPIGAFVVDGLNAFDSATCHIRSGDPALVGSVTCELGTVPAGQGGRIVVTARVRADAPAGPVTNLVSIASDTPDPAAANNVDTFDTTIVQAADLAVSKRILGVPVAGQPVSYEVVVTNLGPSAATAVQVVDTFSANQSYSWDTDSCAPSGPSQITCSLGTIAAGASRTYQVTFNVAAGSAFQDATNTATAGAAQADPNPANNAATTRVPIRGISDLRITKFGKPDAEIRQSGLLTYTILVENLGPSDAANVVVRDTITSDGRYEIISITGASCVPGTGTYLGNVTLECTLPGTLAAFAQAQVRIVLRPIEARSINNFAAVQSRNSDPDRSNDSATVEHDITELADLGVTKSAAPSPAVAGGTVVWTMRVTNDGPGIAENVVLMDRLPAGIVVTGFSASLPLGATGGCTTGAAGSAVDQLKCNLGTLLDGESATVTVTARVDAQLPAGYILENDVMVGSDVLDIRNQNNRATTLTPLTAAADLSISKSAAPSPATAGQPLLYTLTIGNGGPSVAAGTTVVDTLPSGVTFVGAVVVGQPGATCAPVPAGSVTCELGDVLPGQLVSVYIQTVVNPGFAGTLNNSATVRSLTADPSLANNTATTATPVGSSADLSIQKRADRLVVTPGRNFRYTITVRNHGPSDALNVQVLDTLPVGVTLVADQDSCTAVGQNVTCTLGTLLAGQTVTFDLEVAVGAGVLDNVQLLNNARVTSTTPDPVAGNNTAVAEVVTRRLADLAVRKFGKPDGSVRTGEDLTYTILVDNFGPSNTANVVLQDILKADGRFEFRSVSGASCVPAPVQTALQSLTLSCTIGSIPAGTTAQVTIVVRSIDSRSINNVATARSTDAEDPNTANNTGYVEHDVTLLADLAVTKAATGEVVNPGPANCGLLTTPTANAVTAGRALTYVLTVTNNGPSPAENVVVRDRLPAGFMVTGITVGGGGTCTAGTPGAALDVVTCGLDGMAVGQSKTVTIVGRTDAQLPSGLVLANDATVGSALYDANNANNQAHNLTTVGTAADLAITKTAEPAAVVAGQSVVQYTIMVTNNGPSAAQAVSVADTLPAGLVFQSASGAICRQNPASPQQILCQVGDLAPGGMATIYLVARVDSMAPPGILSNTATVASKTADPCAANNVSAPANVTVTRAADVFIMKAALGDPAIAGDLIRWRVMFGNLGPSTATAVRVEDLLPLGVVFQRCESIDPNDAVACAVVAGDGLNVRQTIRLQSLNVKNMPMFTDLGELKAGDSYTFDIVARIDPGYVLDLRGDGDPGEVCAAYGQAAGGYTAFAHNRATITSAQDSGLVKNNFDDVCTRVNGLADLAIDKTLGGCSIVLGDDLATYALTVTNHGPSDAAKVVVTDILPEQIDMATVTVDAGGGMLVSVNPVTREVVVMAGNSDGQVGRINAGAAAVVTIRGNWRPSDLDFEATDTATVTTVRDSVTWPVALAADAADAAVDDGAAADTSDAAHGGAPGDDRDSAQADDPLAPGTRTPTRDPNLANNVKTLTHGVLANPVLLVNKTISLTGQCPGVDVPVMVGPGQPLTYCIEITNRTSLPIEPGALVTDTVTTKLGARVVFTRRIDGPIGPGQKVNLQVTDRFTADACGNATNDVVVTAVIRTGLGDACLRPVRGADRHPIMVPCTDGATGADTRIGLPIINGPAEAACSTWIQVQNVGCENTKALVVFWGDRGACPPQSAGPLKIECTGLLRPGSAWSMLGDSNQIPGGAKSAIVYSVNADDLIKTPRGNDLPFADAACGFLFQAIIGDHLAWAEFDHAYRTAGTFRWVFDNENLDPLELDFGRHPGQPLGVTVNQACPDGVDPNTTNHGGYAGVPSAGTGTYDPTFGGYTYYAPLVLASKGGLSSLIALQNLGIECTSLEIYLKDPDNCLRPIIGDVLALAPGERVSFDPNTVAGPDWIGTAWIRATQPLAVSTATQGPNHLSIYNGVPGDVYSVGFSIGSQVNYAPLTYSEYQGWDSAIAVQNLSATYAAKVKVYFLDRGGDIVTTLVDWVCPRGNQLFFLPVIANIPGNWVGSARVESQEWITPGGPRNDPPRVQSVMLLERWSDPARTSRREAIAYNLLTEQVAYDWQLGSGSGGTASGSAVIAIPLVAKGNRGITSEIGITNLVPKPGFTDFAIYFYDQNGLLDYYCQKLNEKQVEYIDLNAQGFISRNFLGSAVISAVFWEHDVFDDQGAFQRNLVGLGAVVVERVGSAQGAPDAPGDESKGYEGIPVGKPFCESRPSCPGVPEGFGGR